MPANPAGTLITQPDGTHITLYLHGDEHFHWHETPEGYLAVRSVGNEKEWVYGTIQGDGFIVPTGYVVGKADPKGLGLMKVNRALLRQTATGGGTALTSGAATAQTAPTTGTMKNLVVLVNFSDLMFTLPAGDYDNLFNQIGYTADGAVGSVKDYYLQASYNALTVQSVIAGPVTVSHGYAYYGANTGPGGADAHPREMVQEALAALAATGFDFRTVDGNGDGWVDGLDIIHAGGGEEYSGNDPNYIWSHQWSLVTPVTYNGVQMQTYHTEPARRGFDSIPSTQGITRIGVICHETGHFLGLPDLYDTGYDSKGAGDFCLMAGGSWNGSYGSSPAHLSAWCKSTLGWVTPTVLSASGSYALPQVETNQSIYKLQGPFPSSQYFLVENRQGVGFDAGLPGTSRGILIWHIDETQSTNDDQTHYKVDLEEASGTQDLETNANEGDDADYFRTGNATSFTQTTTPNNLSYSGQALGISILGIGPSGSVMTFNASAPPTVTGIVPASARNDGSVNITSLTGTNFLVGAAVKLTRSGQGDRIATNVNVVSPTTLTCTVDLTGAAVGVWNVAVTNPDAQTGTLANGFTVIAPGTVTFLSEPFESVFVGGAPPGWTKSFKTGTVDWIRNSGDSGTVGAHGGSTNALLYYANNSNHETYLITPVLNFPAGTADATLTFWHKQTVRSSRQDTLTVYYSTTSSTGPWIQLATYTSNLTAWTQETLSLPNLSSTYYIAFLGNAKNGFGVCLDDVVVIGVVPPGSISGNLILQDHSGNKSGVPVTVQLRKAGGGTTAGTVYPDTAGNFSMGNIDVGTYDVWLKPSHWLAKVKTGVVVFGAAVDLGSFTLSNGDCDGNNTVNSADLSILLPAIDGTPTSGTDLDGNGAVDSTDLAILLSAMDRAGDS